MKSLAKRTTSFILVFAVLFSLSAMFVPISASAAGLKSTRELLGEYITELYLKGPSVSPSVRENLIAKGFGTGDLFEKRAAFDLRLCSSDEYSGYFFTDKEEFLSSVFGENGTVFLEGTYVWYPSVSAAKKANAGPTMNDALIKYNISNALNFAIDVYGLCKEDDDNYFSDKFNASRKDLASYAIDCIYKIITALENQIGEGTSKPTYYKNDFNETFCTEESGLYPYLDERFRKNTPVMTGYLDSASFTKKTFSYDDLKKSIDIAARLSAFESVYDSYRAQKDGKTLYYDFLISFDRARQAYNDLCSIVLSGENTAPDIKEKAATYMKLRSLGELFATYILPYSDDYSTYLSAMSINYTTIKTLIYFVDYNPYYLSFISLSAMNDLAENFSQSIAKLSPVTDRVLTSQDITGNNATVVKLSDYVAKLEGINGEKEAAVYGRAANAVECLKNISVPEARITVEPQTFYNANGERISSDPFTFSFIPSKSLYFGLTDEARMLCCTLDGILEETVPKLLSAQEKEVRPIEVFINAYSFLFGSSIFPACPVTGNYYAVSYTPSAKAILKKLLSDTWSTDIADDSRIFAADKIFNAAEEYCAYKKGSSLSYLTSNATADLYGFSDYLSDTKNVLDTLEKAVFMTEHDMTLFGFELQYLIRNCAEMWNFQKDASGLYLTVYPSSQPDGTDPSNHSNYKAGAYSKTASDCNDVLSALTDGSSSAKIFVAAKRFDCSARSLLSEYGKDRYTNFTYDLENQGKQYYGSSDISYDLFRTMTEGKGVMLKNHIVLGADGNISPSEVGYKYFAFTVSAASKDETKTANLYSFEDDRIITNLVSPLEVILKTRTAYTGSYSRDFAEAAETALDKAQLLVSSVDRQAKNVGYEITVAEAEELLAYLSQVNFTRANYTLANIASYKASALDALMDRAKAKTVNQRDTAPYYTYLYDLFKKAYSDALSVSYDKIAPKYEIDETANNLSKLLTAIENYEKSDRENLVTVKDFEQKISEAQELLNRYDISEPNMFISDLEAALSAAKAEHAARLSTFTAEDLRYEIKKLDSAILQARNSLIIDELMKKEISKITAQVKSSASYTSDSWDTYSKALSAAELAAAREIEKVSACAAYLNALKEAAEKLEEVAQEEKPEEEPQTEPTDTPEEGAENETENAQQSGASDELYKQANDTYVKSVAELAEYTISPNANAEKIAVWTAAITRLKQDIDAQKTQQELIADIIAVQLAKNLQVDNPETNDN